MEGRCFGRVSHSGHVWGGEGSPERTKRSERAKSTRFPPVKEEIATLVVNKTAAPRPPSCVGDPGTPAWGISFLWSVGLCVCLSVFSIWNCGYCHVYLRLIGAV